MTYTDRERADIASMRLNPDRITDASPEWLADLDSLARACMRDYREHLTDAHWCRVRADTYRRVARAVRREQRKAGR